MSREERLRKPPREDCLLKLRSALGPSHREVQGDTHPTASLAACGWLKCCHWLILQILGSASTLAIPCCAHAHGAMLVGKKKVHSLLSGWNMKGRSLVCVQVFCPTPIRTHATRPLLSLVSNLLVLATVSISLLMCPPACILPQPLQCLPFKTKGKPTSSRKLFLHGHSPP